jgi:hypothetical protein
MKQIIITISMLAIALALITGVIIPLSEHCRETGANAVVQGHASITGIGQLLK